MGGNDIFAVICAKRHVSQLLAKTLYSSAFDSLDQTTSQGIGAKIRTGARDERGRNNPTRLQDKRDGQPDAVVRRSTDALTKRSLRSCHFDQGLKGPPCGLSPSMTCRTLVDERQLLDGNRSSVRSCSIALCRIRCRQHRFSARDRTADGQAVAVPPDLDHTSNVLCREDYTLARCEH